MTEINTDTDALARETEQALTFARRLRALATVIEINPDLTLPIDITVSATHEQLDRWSAALTAAGHAVTDSTDEHARVLSCPPLRIAKVHDEPYRRYLLEQKFLREHAADVDALAAEPVSV